MTRKKEFANLEAGAKILIIENSSPVLSLALISGSRLRELKVSPLDTNRNLIASIDTLLSLGKVKIKDLDALSVGIGPGSFTGLRIACSAAKGINSALGIPLISLTSFLSLTKDNSFQGRNIAVVFDAKRGLIYGAVYKYRQERTFVETPVRLEKIEKFLKKHCSKRCVFTGESVKFKDEIKKIYPEAIISENTVFPDAGCLMPFAEKKYFNKEFTKPDSLEPLYLHPDNCQIRPRNGKWQIANGK